MSEPTLIDLTTIPDTLLELGGPLLLAVAGLSVLFLYVAFVGVIMWFAATVADAEKATLGRSVSAALFSGILATIGGILGLMLPGGGREAGVILAMIAAMIGIKMIFATGLRKALIIWILNLCASSVLFFAFYAVFAVVQQIAAQSSQTAG
ncbi:MAG: hypothetical protein KGZ25_03565 [Planctomycetes bacterium]|nr:hypothetical protein [Planctomycetota bacterium]